MSRVGKKPVELPKGVQASVAGNVISIQGPKGKLQYTLGRGVTAKVEGSNITFTASDTNDSQVKANWGSARANILNMVSGVNQVFTKTLELQGVGYNAAVQKNALKLVVGLSHEVLMPIPQGIAAKVDKQTTVILESSDKQLLGNFAANVRKIRPPEPYLGKGIRIVGQYVRRKAGKAGKK